LKPVPSTILDELKQKKLTVAFGRLTQESTFLQIWIPAERRVTDKA
jgi:hypothetical protein